MSRVEEIVERISAVPPLPGFVVRLIQVTNDPDSSIRDVVEVIRYEPSVTAQVLRLCNSAFFGLPRRISSVQEAVQYLGTLRVLQLIMSLHGNALLAREQQGYGLDPGALWMHSVAVGLASAALSQQTRTANPSALFTAGLLHDIGKVVLNEFVAGDQPAIVERVEQGGLSFAEAEKQVLGYSHDEVGGELADRWQLPPAIVNCIRYHHAPSAMAEPDALVDLVYLGDAIGMLLGLGIGSDGLQYRADETVLARRGLGEADLERVSAQTAAELARVAELFEELMATPRRRPPPVAARQEAR